MGVDLPPEYGPARKATPVWRRLADVKKAERQIGFRSKVSLEEGLRQLVLWWSKETGTVVKGLQTSGATRGCTPFRVDRFLRFQVKRPEARSLASGLFFRSAPRVGAADWLNIVYLPEEVLSEHRSLRFTRVR